jgi:hypothetical protein
MLPDKSCRFFKSSFWLLNSSKFPHTEYSKVLLTPVLQRRYLTLKKLQSHS